MGGSIKGIERERERGDRRGGKMLSGRDLVSFRRDENSEIPELVKCRRRRSGAIAYQE